MNVCRRVGAGVTCSTDWWAFSGSRCTVVWQATRIPMVSPGQRRSVLSDCELVKASKSGVSGLGRSSSKCGPGRAPRCRPAGSSFSDVSGDGWGVYTRLFFIRPTRDTGGMSPCLCLECREIQYGLRSHRICQPHGTTEQTHAPAHPTYCTFGSYPDAGSARHRV